MSTDTVAVILTVILAVGGAYVGLSRSIAQLGERVARVEGIIDGWLNPPPSRDQPRPVTLSLQQRDRSDRRTS